METTQRRVRELTKWVRNAKKGESFAALPAALKEFVQGKKLAALSSLVPDDIRERVDCIKRRSQNHKALQLRKQKKAAAIEGAVCELNVHRDQCRLLTAHVRAMAEYETHLSTAGENRLFGPAMQAAILFEHVHAKRDPAAFGVESKAAAQGKRNPGNGQSQQSEGPVSERVLEKRPKKRRVAVGAAVGDG